MLCNVLYITDIRTEVLCTQNLFLAANSHLARECHNINNLPSPVDHSSIIFTQMPIKGNVAVSAQLASARAATVVWKV